MKISLRNQRVALLLILVLALLLRLKGIHNPIIDHPGWRQGDEAAIARNFAYVDRNPLHPQADYNGPGPNYVELELQIVPYLASCLYSFFGVHEVFGRLVSVTASLGTIAVLFSFGRWLFLSPLTGLGAALFYAIAPGAIYYGRTFQPDTTMVFFLTAALYVGSRSLLEDDQRAWRGSLLTTLLVLMAILAKSVAILLFCPLIAVSIQRYGLKHTLLRPQSFCIALGSLVPFWLYDQAVRSIATWKWASGITTLHVIPGLKMAFTSPGAFINKLGAATNALVMLAHTMLGPVLFALFLFGFLVLPKSRSKTLLLSWLAAGVAYLYVVVTVERVDYYLYPLVPLAALVAGAFLSLILEHMSTHIQSHREQKLAFAYVALVLVVTLLENRREISGYYEYNHQLVRQAKYIDAKIPQNSLVVVGHLDPSTLYYIHRRGWQEDPFLWTTFDEQSAIAKGARYFVVVEPDRLKRNIELSAWLKRFPKLKTPPHVWRVYITDPALILPGADAEWRAFRDQERSSKTLRQGQK